MPLTETDSARRVIGALSLVVLSAVALVLYATPNGGERETGPDTLATVNAVLNGGSAVCLLLGYAFIRRKRVALHRACMVTAFTLSSIFLFTYLLHHAKVGSVPFKGQGLLRGVYFAVLIPHVVLAAVVVPLALTAIYRGHIGDVSRHKSIARRTLPIWLYVSMSGVLVYVMLYR